MYSDKGLSPNIGTQSANLLSLKIVLKSKYWKFDYRLWQGFKILSCSSVSKMLVLWKPYSGNNTR